MGPSVLIIEDDREVSQVVADCLIADGCKVRIAEDSIQGLQAVRRAPPDLIFLDLMLPGGGGMAVLESLKKAVDTQYIPVIVMTGTKDVTLKKKLLACGIKSYLQKPFTPAELTHAIAQLSPAPPASNPPKSRQ